MKLIAFKESRRTFLKTAAKSAAVLSVVTVVPVAVISLLKPKPKFIADLDVNSMYAWRIPTFSDEGSLHLDTNTNKIHQKIALNEKYGKLGMDKNYV